MLNIKEIKARSEKATPGPWKNGTGFVRDKSDRQICGLLTTRGKFEEEDANAEFIAHARTDIPALIAEVERIRGCKCVDKCKLACMLNEYDRTIAERDTLKNALELMAAYLAHFGRLDEMLCDDIPQPLHLKYQPKNDGDYENEPCIKCVQDYFIQQAQEQEVPNAK